MTETELKHQVRRLVAADNLDEAFGLLAENLADGRKLDDITLQIARLNELKKVRANGMISHAEISQGMNQLRSALLFYVRTETLPVKEKETAVPDHKNALRQLEDQLVLSVARLRVAQVLPSEFAEEAGLTMSEIHRESQIKSRKRVVDVVNELVTAGILEKTKADRTRCRLHENGKALLKKILETG